MIHRKGWLLILLLAVLVPSWLLAEQYQYYGINFQLAPGGVFAMSASSLYNENELVTGYGTEGGQNRVAGMAVLRYRSAGVLVSEAAEPLVDSEVRGKFYARLDGNVNTGIAITATSTQQTDLTYTLLDTNGVTVKTDVISLNPAGRLTAFLNEAPFSVTGAFEGTFNFTANRPVYVLPIRGITNERGEFLFTTLPPVVSNYGATEYLVPHFADGGGWTTQVQLVNDQAFTESGIVSFFDSGNLPSLVTVNNQTASSFPYSIPAGGALRLETAGTGLLTQTGVVRVAGNFSSAPKTNLLFSYRRNGVTVTEASAPANFPPSGQAAYFYGQILERDSANLESKTGFAVFNRLSSSPIAVTVQLTNPDGSIAGTGAFTLQNQQRASMFLDQVPGLENIPKPFRGMVQLFAPASSGLYVMALRGTVNERGDFLLSTTPSFVLDNRSLQSYSFWGGTGLAHLAFGLGYTAEFVAFSNQFMDSQGQFGPANSGGVAFHGPLGKAFLRFQ